jgi:hypothetical protein
MTYLDGFYQNPHRTQYDGVGIDVSSGCTWTSGTNGADAATGGKVSKTPSQVHALIPNAQETDPSTPGWSVVDLVHAMAKLGVPFVDRTGKGWAAVQAAHAAGQYVVLQGVSSHFGNNTCSGAFDGNHAIGAHPATSEGNWWTDDPICKTGRWESPAILRAYAEALLPGIRFGVFTTAVPKQPVPAPTGHTLHIATGAKIVAYKVVGRGPGLPGVLVMPPAKTMTWTKGPSHVACGAEAYRKTQDGTSHAYTVEVPSGAFAGLYVNSRSPGITITTP